MPRGHGEGSVYQRKDGRWVAEITLEDHSRKQFYAKTKKEAIELRRAAINDMKQGSLATGPQQTVKQYLEYWLEEVHRPTIRIGTYKNYSTIVDNHLIPALGHIRLQKLTTQHLQKFYSQRLRDGLSAVRVLNIHRVLRKALDNAVRTNLIGRNVCDYVELPRKEEHEIQVLTGEQAKKLLVTVSERRLEALLTLALATGMRKGEMLGLRWQDIDLEKGFLQIRRTLSFVTGHGYIENEPKTKRGRRGIMLPSFVIESLKRHKALQLEAKEKAGKRWVERDLVFCNRHGNYFHPGMVFTLFNEALKDAELSHIRFHDLRHSAATLLLSMGVHPKVVQELLGHSTITITLDIYSHVLPPMQGGAMDKMNDFFK